MVRVLKTFYSTGQYPTTFGDFPEGIQVQQIAVKQLLDGRTGRL
jgi:hypothetical protein